MEQRKASLDLTIGFFAAGQGNPDGSQLISVCVYLLFFGGITRRQYQKQSAH
jgi:hypothetical protein